MHLAANFRGFHPPAAVLTLIRVTYALDGARSGRDPAVAPVTHLELLTPAVLAPSRSGISDPEFRRVFAVQDAVTARCRYHSLR